MIFGLENSGKTSIFLSVKKDTNLLSFYGLKPTKGLNINTIEGKSGEEVAVWDFGGQENYRIEYMEKFETLSSGASELIYVIDVQDNKRYGESLKYFKQIIDKINKEKIKPKISVYLHKYDPYITNKKQFKDLDDNIQLKLIPQIKEIIPSNLESNIFKTTIFTTFERYIVE